MSEVAPSWTDEEWELNWQEAKRLQSALWQNVAATLDQLSRAVYELQKSEVPRVWQRARRANFEVSLLECNAVRVGRVRVILKTKETLALQLLAEREREVGRDQGHIGELL